MEQLTVGGVARRAHVKSRSPPLATKGGAAAPALAHDLVYPTRKLYSNRNSKRVRESDEVMRSNRGRQYESQRLPLVEIDGSSYTSIPDDATEPPRGRLVSRKTGRIFKRAGRSE